MQREKYITNKRCLAYPRCSYVQEWKIGRGQMTEFLTEVDLMSRAVHRHCLPLEGFCIEGGERILVFPYMPNGSVESHLGGACITKGLPLHQIEPADCQSLWVA